MKTYSKNNEVVGVDNKFIYHIEIYIAWKNGVAFYDEKWYSIDKPLKFKKKDNILKKKKYKWIRYVTLCYAPQSYLEQNGYEEDY